MSYNQPQYARTPKLNYRFPKIILKSIKETASIEKYFENKKRESLLIQSSVIEQQILGQVKLRNQQINKINNRMGQFLQVKNIASNDNKQYYGFNPNQRAIKIPHRQVFDYQSETESRNTKSIINQSLNSSHQQEYLNQISSRSICHNIVSSSKSLDQHREQSSEIQTDNQKRKQKYINFLQNNFSLPYKKVMEEYIRQQKALNYFRLWSHIIIFIQRLKSLAKFNSLRVLKILKNIKRDLSVFEGTTELQDIKNTWCSLVFDKVKIFLNSHKFTSPFKNNKNFSQAKFQQLKCQVTIIQANKLFQSLNEMIKQSVFPVEILKLSQLHIMQIMKNCPLFVSQRVSPKLLKPEQTLIMCEYVLFELLINTIIETSNNLQCLNEKHLIECKFQLITLCTLIQLLFMNHFQKMKQHSATTGQLSQKRLIVHRKTLYLEIIKDQEIDNTQVILAGLQNQEYLVHLISSEQEWYKEIQRLFQNFIKELDSQNQI